MSDKNLVLRTVYMDPEVDDELRDQAYAGRRSKNDLVRMYIKMGMEAARLGAALGKPRVIATKFDSPRVRTASSESTPAPVLKKSAQPLSRSSPVLKKQAAILKKPASVLKKAAPALKKPARPVASATKAAPSRSVTASKKAAPKRAVAR